MELTFIVRVCMYAYSYVCVYMCVCMCVNVLRINFNFNLNISLFLCFFFIFLFLFFFSQFVSIQEVVFLGVFNIRFGAFLLACLADLVFPFGLLLVGTLRKRTHYGSIAHHCHFNGSQALADGDAEGFQKDVQE